MKKLLSLLLALLMLTGCTPAPQETAALLTASQGETWYAGFGCSEITADNPKDLYISGYHNGKRIAGVLDAAQARALWLDTGSEGVLIISVDCIGLSSGTVQRIREQLSDLPNCAAVNVCSTHTHAGPDTLGLWGPVAIDGKDDAYMQSLVNAAVSAARQAAANRQPGTLHFGQARTENLLEDSRQPHVYDENLYQLRFEPLNASAGIRLLLYGAHAESLRSNNYMLSRDYPGLLCDTVEEKTGDRAMFLTGAIGGLIMTRGLVNANVYPTRNLTMTGELLTDYALSITPESEQTLSPSLALARSTFTVPMDNTAFLYYRFLGILDNPVIPGKSATGYHLKSELSVLRAGSVTLALIPGEIFPELVWGGSWGQANPDGVNPEPLADIAARYGVETLLIAGLSNDELGYIVPPSDFLVNSLTPYLAEARDASGENHYEETNSVGPACAETIAEAFEAALSAF